MPVVGCTSTLALPGVPLDGCAPWVSTRTMSDRVRVVIPGAWSAKVRLAMLHASGHAVLSIPLKLGSRRVALIPQRAGFPFGS